MKATGIEFHSNASERGASLGCKPAWLDFYEPEAQSSG